jgi:hypothetical protein
MVLRPAPNRLPKFALPQVVREYLAVREDVGTAQENRVAFTPFYWQSA